MNLALSYEAPAVRRDNLAPQYNAYLLNVHFATAAGDEWSALGGGDSVAEAIAVAREALPAGRAWSVSGWNHWYGE